MDTPRFTASANTRLLAQRLRSAAEGEIVTYPDLSAEIGRSVSGATATLHSARRMLRRDHMIVFDVVTGVGLKRLGDRDIVATSSRMARNIRRHAERGVATLACVRDFGALPRGDQMRHTAVAATICAVAQMTSEKSLSEVGSKIEPTARELPLRETLAMFIGNTKVEEATP